MKKKLLLDEYDLKMVINGLHQMRGKSTNDTIDQIESLKSYLVMLLEGRVSIPPTRKKKAIFQPSDYSLMIRCLVDWRNQKIKAGETGQAEIISEMIIKLN